MRTDLTVYVFAFVLVAVSLASGFLLGNGMAPQCNQTRNPLAYIFADFEEAQGVAEQIDDCVGIARRPDGWTLEHCE